MNFVEVVLAVGLIVGFLWQGIHLACLEQTGRELQDQLDELNGDVAEHAEVLQRSRAFRDRHGRFYKTARSRRTASGEE
jgi:hypothetical protein